MDKGIYRIDKNKISVLFDTLFKLQKLYLPIENRGRISFSEYSGEKTKGNVDIKSVITGKPVKELFFPQKENLVSFEREDKEIRIKSDSAEVSPFTVFGVRACDIKSLEILDRVFLSPPEDSFYRERRSNATIISLACNSPDKNCFCTSFGIDPAEGGGDISCFLSDSYLYWKPVTEKGLQFTAKISGNFEELTTRTDYEIALETIRKGMGDFYDGKIGENPLGSDKLEEVFSSDKWDSLSWPCIGCGTCTFICPTCQCYDIRDYDNGESVERYRCWDSCMYSDFVKMAHGNPRKSQKEKFRQRFMHKLFYFPAENDGIHACTGCGRCIRHCPNSMNIMKVIKAFGGDKNV